MLLLFLRLNPLNSLFGFGSGLLNFNHTVLLEVVQFIIAKHLLKLNLIRLFAFHLRLTSREPSDKSFHTESFVEQLNES